MLKKTLSSVLIVDDLVEIVNDYYYDYEHKKRLLILSLQFVFKYYLHSNNILHTTHNISRCKNIIFHNNNKSNVLTGNVKNGGHTDIYAYNYLKKSWEYICTYTSN